MKSLAAIRAKAKEQANRTGHALAIYNFNAYAPLYVIRDASPGEQEQRREFVEQINPD